MSNPLIADFLLKNQQHKLKISIIGDCLIDEYYAVKVHRISPESPAVKVMTSADDQPSLRKPGGAANVVYNLKNFNVDAKLYSIIDDDAYQLFQDNNLGIEPVFLPGAASLPCKKRFFDGETQVGDRWDIESKWMGLQEDQLREYTTKLANVWHNKTYKPAAVILSDYNKGIFQFGCDNFDLKDYLTIVDPKKLPIQKWYGCTVFKPNCAEAEELSQGLTDWQAQCDYFQKELACQAVIITLAGDGIVGKAKDYFSYYPEHKLQSNKNEGAGDCFIATLALALGHGFNYEESAQIAFQAGTLYVKQGKRQPLLIQDFEELIYNEPDKITHLELLKNRNFKLVWTNGVFDFGLTAGHIATLQEAKKLGGKLVVALNSDASVKRLKGSQRPILPLDERMRIVAALGCVDYVISFDEDTPLNVIKYIMPDIIVKSSEYQPEQVIGYGITKIHIVPQINCLSTTAKINSYSCI